MNNNKSNQSPVDLPANSKEGEIIQPTLTDDSLSPSVSNDHVVGTIDTETVKNTPLKKGEIILDLYRIEDDQYAGGYGQVYRVHHTGWKVDMAMKMPLPEKFLKEDHKKLFKEECETWMELGLHPHIVTCYYVREVDSIPSIFAEWMGGGSLKEWIKKDNGEYGRLYEGREKDALERILNISIQVVRGLHYAHNHNPEKVLIHQDVKPANLLLTADGNAKVFTAKVADFGIVNAKSIIAGAGMGVDAHTSGSKTALVSRKGFTSAYCSPEQANGEKLTRRTDIWSWAVTTLEMFMGNCPWDYPDPEIAGGVWAGTDCEYYFRQFMRVPMPEAVKDLLRWCFKIDEAERPHDFGVVAAELLKIYLAEIGDPYPRPEPKAASLVADSLNNRALSYIDLGEPEKAEKCWEEALENQPNHPDSVFNKAVYLWRNTKIDIVQAADMIGNMYKNNQDKFHALWLYLNFCIERHDYGTAGVLFFIDKDYVFQNTLMYRDYIKIRNILRPRGKTIVSDSTYSISNQLTYTGLFHITDNGKTIISCSWQGVEKWELNFSDQGIPESARCVYKNKWQKEQIKVLAICDNGRYVLTLEGKEKNNAKEIKQSRIPLTKNNVAKIMMNELSQKEKETYHYDLIFKDSVIDSFIYRHFILCVDEFMHLTNGNAICLWSPENNSCLCRFESKLFENAQLIAACFDLDNHQVMTVAWSDGEDHHGELATWDIATGKNVRKVVINEKGVTATAFSPDRKLLLTGNNIGEVRLFDISTGKLWKTINEDDQSQQGKKRLAKLISFLDLPGMEIISISSVYFIPNSRCVCAVGSNGSYRQWDIDTGQLLYGYPKGFFKDLYFFPDNKHIYSIFADIRIIDITTGRCLCTHTSYYPNHIAFLPDPRFAVTTSIYDDDGIEKALLYIETPDLERAPNIIWSISRIVPTNDLLEQENIFRQILEKIRACMTNEDIKNTLIHLEEAFNLPYVSNITELQKLNDTVSRNCLIGKVRSISRINISDSFKKTENHYTFSPEGYIIAKGKLYDIVNDKYSCTVEKNFTRYSFSPDNKFIYGTINQPSDKQHHIMALDAQTGKYLFTFDEPHNKIIQSITVSYDGKYLLTGSNDKTAKLWNIDNRKCQLTILHQKEVKDARFGPKLSTIVTISSQFANLHGDVVLWNINDHKIKHIIHKDACSISTNHNNTMLLLGVMDGIELFNLQNRSFISKCTTENNTGVECPTKIRFLPDERFAISVDSKGRISYWNLSGKKCMASFQCKGESMDLHPNGNYVLNYLNENCLLRIEHQYEFPGWSDWDEGARPYLDIFLTLHPNWTNNDFNNILIPDLQNRGYGWLRPDEVRKELEKMSALIQK